MEIKPLCSTLAILLFTLTLAACASEPVPDTLTPTRLVEEPNLTTSGGNVRWTGQAAGEACPPAEAQVVPAYHDHPTRPGAG